MLIIETKFSKFVSNQEKQLVIPFNECEMKKQYL